MSRSSIETTHYYYAPNPYINDNHTPPDTKLLDQTLGNRTLLSYGTACTAVLLACEVSRGLIAGALWGAAEAAAVCGLPTATAYLTRNTIAEEFRKTESLLTLDALYFGAGPASAAAGTLAAHMGIRTLTHDKIQRLAKYLEEGKPRKISFLKRRLARKYVVEYFDTLFEGTGLAEQLDEAAKIKILANTTKQQLADILAAFTELRSKLGDDKLIQIFNNLKEGKVEAAAGAIEGYIQGLRNDVSDLKERINDLKKMKRFEVGEVEQVGDRYSVTITPPEGVTPEELKGYVEEALNRRGVEATISVEGGKIEIIARSRIDPDWIGEIVTEIIDEGIENLQKEYRELERIVGEVEGIRRNTVKSVEEVKPNRSFLRELAESAMCSIPAFLAGTLAAQATAGDLFLPDIETLHVALTPTGIKVGDVEVG